MQQKRITALLQRPMTSFLNTSHRQVSESGMCASQSKCGPARAKPKKNEPKVVNRADRLLLTAEDTHVSTFRSAWPSDLPHVIYMYLPGQTSVIGPPETNCEVRLKGDRSMQDARWGRSQKRIRHASKGAAATVSQRGDSKWWNRARPPTYMHKVSFRAVVLIIIMPLVSSDMEYARCVVCAK